MLQYLITLHVSQNHCIDVVFNKTIIHSTTMIYACLHVSQALMIN